MHAEAIKFVEQMRAQYPDAFQVKRVLECGSMDMGGTPRGFFQGAEYVGVDWRKGPGVDAVSLIHEYRDKPDGHFDFAISMETFEHDPYWEQSLRRMCQLVRTGGFLLITCAGAGREPHAAKTSPMRGYYKNFTSKELHGSILDHSAFMASFREDDAMARDVRCFWMDKV